MLIPSIDLMGGKIVQLVQGEKKALEFDNFDYWIERFSKYPLVQLIDLDAARGTGNNEPLVNQIVRRLNCQVGGGIRNLENAQQILQAGAHRVILGSSLLKDGDINTEFASTLMNALGPAMERSTCDSAAKLMIARGRYSASSLGTRVRSPISPRTSRWLLWPSNRLTLSMFPA